MHKSRSIYRDGYKANLAVEPETGLVTVTGPHPGQLTRRPTGLGLPAGEEANLQGRPTPPTARARCGLGCGPLPTSCPVSPSLSSLHPGVSTRRQFLAGRDVGELLPDREVVEADPEVDDSASRIRKLKLPRISIGRPVGSSPRQGPLSVPVDDTQQLTMSPSAIIHSMVECRSGNAVRVLCKPSRRRGLSESSSRASKSPLLGDPLGHRPCDLKVCAADDITARGCGHFSSWVSTGEAFAGTERSVRRPSSDRPVQLFTRRWAVGAVGTRTNRSQQMRSDVRSDVDDLVEGMPQRPSHVHPSPLRLGSE